MSMSKMGEMIHIIESFFCGLAFACGVGTWFFVRDLATAKGRAEIKEEMQQHAKRVEDRLEVQVATMVACLEEIRKQPHTSPETK